MHVLRLQATGGFAGPGSLSGAPTGSIFLTDADGGAVSVSGTFTRDDGAVLPSSTSVFFYVAVFLQPGFVRGQGTLDSSTGEFTADVTDITAGFSTLFLSFVVTDPAEALVSGADTVFPLLILSANNCFLPPLTINLYWFGADSDMDLVVTEPGGTVVDSGSRFGVSTKWCHCVLESGCCWSCRSLTPKASVVGIFSVVHCSISPEILHHGGAHAVHIWVRISCS